MIRPLLTAVAIALAAPATAAPYCDRAQAVSQLLDSYGYLPVYDEWTGTADAPSSTTRWEMPATDLWVETRQEGLRSCIFDHHPQAGMGAGKIAKVDP